MTRSGALQQLANVHGVQLSYYDISGRQHEAAPDSLIAVLRVLGVPLNGEADADSALAAHIDQPAAIEPVLVAWNGWLHHFQVRGPHDGSIRFELQLEDGSSREGELQLEHTHDGLRGSIPENLPLGYHRLLLDTPDAATAFVISGPWRAHPGHKQHGDRSWGTFLPLYAVRAARNQGIGDYTSLATLARWTGQLGAAYFGTLPLLATFVDQPFEPSPYSPISRLFWSEVFLDVQAASALADPQIDVAHAQGEFATAVARLNTCDLVDYKEVARLKRQALEPVAQIFFDSHRDQTSAFRAFLKEYPGVRDYSAFRAACDHQRSGWTGWPERMRHGTLKRRDYDLAAARYHLFTQFAAAQQLAGVSRADGAQLYLDLPLGVHPDGFDVWRNQQLFATGVSTGAPPDDFFTQGQDWGFPPMNPGVLRAQGYAYLRAAIRTHLRYAGALRLDHVMALHRLFWVPSGMKPGQGVYVRYPASELYALLCLESHRHNALIVGEDLGTVPPEVREQMAEHEIARMYVVQFELRSYSHDPLPEPPARSVVSLNTHDMPTFEAFRRALDADMRGELGLLGAEEITAARHARRELLHALAGQLERAGFLHGPADSEQLRDALLGFLAASSARLLLVSLEDLWREDQPQNVPGTSAERPNWRRRTRPSLEEIMNSPDVAAVLSRLNEIRCES